MDSRWLAVAVALVALAASTVAGALAPGTEAVCPPEAFECWDPYELTARMATWSLGLAAAAALVPAFVRHRAADLLAVPASLAGGLWIFLGTVFSSPGTPSPCRFAACPEPAAEGALFSLAWGVASASLLLHALRAPPRRGATVAAGVAIGLLPPGVGLLLSGHGGPVDAAAYALLAAALAGTLASWALLRPRPGRASA